MSSRTTERRPDLRTDWDDLRYFLAVARGGSISAAAKALAVNHATVSRRLHAFEERIGARLFDRLPGGFVPTAMGEEMHGAARRVEEEMLSLDRRVLGHDAQLTGKLRVALSDAAAFALMGELRAFGTAYPGIELELTASNVLTNLSRRDADVAIRVTESPAEHLVGRKLGITATALYVSTGYLEANLSLTALHEQGWLAWDESSPDYGATRWMREHVPNARVVARFDSILLLHHALVAGLGIGFLPCALGDREATIRRVEPHVVLPGTGMWLLTHPDLRDTARVRCFLDFMARAMASTRDLREGRRPLRAGSLPVD